MDKFIEKILINVEYKIDYNGKILKKEKGLIPIIDENKTRANIRNLIEEMLKYNTYNKIIEMLINSITYIKDVFAETHDGFRKARNESNAIEITVSDIYAFSTAIGYAFEMLPSSNKNEKIKVGIGTIYPAGQDAGKNLIKAVWQASGVNVIDLGKKIKSEKFIDAIEKNDLSIIGISCMDSKCIEELEKLVIQIKKVRKDIAIIIGGIAVNKVIAYELSKKYEILVYYGHDIMDAESVLKKAIARKNVDKPDVGIAKNFEIDDDIKKIASESNLRLTQISINDIIIDENARKGCKFCSGDKKAICPLEIGFEKQKDIQESIKFIKEFKFAVLVSTNILDESQRQKCKKIWLSLLKIEQHLNSKYKSAFAFKLPMVCPFCKVSECKLSKGMCTFLSYYRPLHEQYNINLNSASNAVRHW